MVHGKDRGAWPARILASFGKTWPAKLLLARPSSSHPPPPPITLVVAASLLSSPSQHTRSTGYRPHALYPLLIARPQVVLFDAGGVADLQTIFCRSQH
jgi:hypothetical protein